MDPAYQRSALPPRSLMRTHATPPSLPLTHTRLQICADADPGLVPMLRLSDQTLIVHKYKSAINIKLGPTSQLLSVQPSACQLKVSLCWNQVESTFLHVRTNLATPSWANKTVCLRAGMHVPINSKREGERKPDVYFHSCSFTASCPCGWLPVYIRKGKSWAESIKQQQSNRKTPPLECLRFVLCEATQSSNNLNRKKK